MAGKALTAFALASFALLTGCDDASGTTVGPEGGIVVSDDGRMALDIPAGALSEATTISLHRSETGPEAAVASYDIEPRNTMLARPALVTYDWAADDDDDGIAALNLANDGGGAELAIQSNKGWSDLADQSVDHEQAFTQASLLYFASVAVFSAE